MSARIVEVFGALVAGAIAAGIAFACCLAIPARAEGGNDSGSGAGVSSGKEYKRHGQYKTWSR